MSATPAYEINQKVYASSTTVIYRATRYRDDRPVILKLANKKQPSVLDEVRLKYENALLQSLNHEHLLKTLGLDHYQNNLALVLEDEGLISLESLLKSHPLPTAIFLPLAWQLVELLDYLQKQGIIHQQICRHHLLVNEQKTKIKLIDWSRASRFPQDIAPELQKSRHFLTDHRTDLLALGVTFYEMLTGQSPFSQSPLTLSKLPTPPVRFQLGISPTLSAIVMKLLAPYPEDRYQTACSLKQDLETCLNQINNKTQVLNFPLGQTTANKILQQPQKLYGKNEDLNRLLTFFNQQERGPNQWVLITGGAGVGKSTLTHHLQVNLSSGYFIRGKWSPLEPQKPYGGLVEACSQLLQQILHKTPRQIQDWQNKLIAALGVNDSILLAAIPELKKFIISPHVPTWDTTENQQRFRLALQKFFEVILAEEKLVILVLENLEWADAASLDLIKILLTDSHYSHLLIAGTYQETTPLLEQIREEVAVAGVHIRTFSLNPLGLDSFQEWLGAALAETGAKIEPLGKILYEQTRGNLLYAWYSLCSLQSERKLIFDREHNQWQWSQLPEALAASFEEVISHQFYILKPKLQQLLKLAACLGNTFNLETLALVNGSTITETIQDLEGGIQFGLIRPLTELYKYLPFLTKGQQIESQSQVEYQFCHEQIQQSIYSLIPAELKPEIHFKIGSLLFSKTDLENPNAPIFTLAYHFNLGRPLIQTPLDREPLLWLNLLAGQKAKAIAAYATAVTYFTIALELVDDRTWRENYHLAFTLAYEGAETEFFNQNISRAKHLVGQAVTLVKNPLDRVKLYQLIIQFDLAEKKIKPAIKTGLKALEILEVHLEPTAPTNLDVEILANLPPMVDTYKQQAMTVLNTIFAAACYGESTLALPILYTMLSLSVHYGNSPSATYCYCNYATLLAQTSLDIDLGYKFSQLGLTLVDRLEAGPFKAQCLVTFAINILHRKDRIRQTLNPLREAIQSGLETGNLEFAGHGASFYCIHLFFAGERLTSVQKAQTQYLKFIEDYGQVHPLYLTQIFRQLVIDLMGSEESKAFDKKKDSVNLKERDDSIALFYFYFTQTYLFYLMGDTPKAIEFAQKAAQHSNFLQSEIVFLEYSFYYALALLVEYDRTQDTVEQDRLMTQVETLLERIKIWADHGPMNYQHKFELLEAERNRVVEDFLDAMDYYDRAIAGAKEEGFLQVEALAWERAGQFYLSLGREKIAKDYLTEARNCYQTWGATVKVADLVAKFPQFFSTLPAPSPGDEENPLITTTINPDAGLDTSLLWHRETSLEQLLPLLLKTFVEQLGAETGYLIIEQQGVWGAIVAADMKGVKLLPFTPIAYEDGQIPIVCAPIVQRVLQTQEPIILEHGSQLGEFTEEFYIRKNAIKSLCCAPLLDGSQLSGIIYLENKQRVGAFADSLSVVNLLGKSAAIALINGRLYQALVEINYAYDRFVPNAFLQLLEKKSIADVELGDRVEQEMSVLVASLRDFHTLVDKLTPAEAFYILNDYLASIEPAITEHQGLIAQYRGDSILALFTGPQKADQSLQAAISMLQRLQEYNQRQSTPLQLGIGIDTGTLILGTVGSQNFMDVGALGLPVYLASRLESLTHQYKANLFVTQTTLLNLQNASEYHFRIIERIAIADTSQILSVFEIFDADTEAIKQGKSLSKTAFEQALVHYNLRNYKEASKRFEECLQICPHDTIAQNYWELCFQAINNFNVNL